MNLFSSPVECRHFVGPTMYRIQVLVALTGIMLLVSCGGGGGGGSQGTGSYLALQASPNPVTIYPSSVFVIRVTASTNTQAVPAITSVQLPAGITTTTTFPMTIASGASGGSPILFQTSDTIATGNYTLTLNGEAGSITSSTNISATLQAGEPGFFISHGSFSEIGVPIGGSGQMQFTTGSGEPGDYQIQLSLSGLPSGTTATINPATVTLGQSALVTITASSTAPESQNVTVTLTGTPEAPGPSTSVNILVDITPPPGSLSNNRTDYISTEDTPYAAVYDPVHQLIFASNNSWNRIDVISAATHTIQTRIPVRDPRGIDITQDSSTIWVATGSRQLYAINTSNFAVTRYVAAAGSLGDWQGGPLFALADGTLMILLTSGNQGISGLAIWNPPTNAIIFPKLPTGQLYTYSLYRSGNGGRVYFLDGTTAGENFYYDVSSGGFGNPVTMGGAAIDGAVNVDSSRVYVCDANGPNMYDGNLNLIGPLPACGVGPPFFQGGSVFSLDNRYLYQEAPASVPWIIKVDPNTLGILSLAPAMPMIPVGAEMGPPFYLPSPFAVDNSGLVIGIEDWGIAFDDAAYAQNYAPSQPGTPTLMQHMSPYFGPLSGGTVSGGFGNAFATTPDVWYGANKGTAQHPEESPSITSPPSSTPGPVNIKMLFPDGIEVFDPLFFSYGPYLQYPLVSGAPPQGTVAAQIVGYGMPGDNVTGTLTVGGSAASLVPGGPNGLPVATIYPNKTLSYTVPAGTPGWADITVTTSDGSSTLPKGMFYAQSVTDYSSSDTFTAVLYDQKRDQLYLSAGDHIDVFSLNSRQFQSPLTPPAAQGTAKLFAGLALTTDGSLLLVTDLADGSLAVLNPDTPGNSYAVPVSAPSGSCNYGPLYVASTSNNAAFVTTGGLPGAPSCSSGALFVVDLSSRTAGPPPQSASCAMLTRGYPSYVASTQDGAKVAIGGPQNTGVNFCIYDVASGTYNSNPIGLQNGATISGDGNVAASELVLIDSFSNTVGWIARPDVYYSYLRGPNGPQILPEPVMNAAGSLYYMAYPNFFDIVDVQHAILRMRFSLSETVSNTAVPMAIDAGGRSVYLITNKGLTVVDLGEAPLSIGWLNTTSGSLGAQVTIRGSGFNTSTSATVNGQAATVSVTDENTLVFTIPSIAAGPAAIVLTNGDGTSYTAVGLLAIK